MAENIADIIADFEAKMKPVSAADLQMAKGETPKTGETLVPVAEPEVEEGEACANKGFKELIGVIPSLYMGINIKEMMVAFLEAQPECEV